MQANPLGEFSFYLLAALSELVHAGEVELRTQAHRLPNEPGHWIEIKDRETGSHTAVSIDTSDGPQLVALRRAAIADLVWKRSYQEDHLVGLSAEIFAKVKPFGLWYACRSGRETQQMLGRLAHLARGVARLDKAGLVMIRNAFGLRQVFAGRASAANLPPLVADYEALPVPASPRVIFQTRVWDPSEGADPDDRRKVNDMRASLVRSLRSALGENFVGGLSPSVYAQNTYPDCLTRHAVDSTSYRRLLLGCDIAINSTGLHGSNAFKIPEYFASSRVVVSERLLCELPRPPIEGIDFLCFDSPGECVATCQRLLSDAEGRLSLMKAGRSYYDAFVQPAASLRSRLDSLVLAPES